MSPASLPTSPSGEQPRSTGGFAGVRRWTSIVFPLIAAAACFAAFWPNIPGGRFLNWDDDQNILQNYDFRGLSPRHLHWMWTTGKMGHYQPLSWTSLGLDYVLWGMTGPDYPEAARFRLTNLLLHAAGAAAFYFLSLRLLRIGAAPHRGLPDVQPDGGSGDVRIALAALVATLLYAIHPLRCESVCWVTERRDVLSGLFFILALTAYLRANPPGVRMQHRAGRLAAAVGLAGGSFVLFLATINRENKFNLEWTRLGAPGFALLLSMIAAAAWAGSRALICPEQPRRAAWMLAAFALLAASLFSKAWAMVMPVLFLLIDYWPLRRLEVGIASSASAGGAAARGDKRRASVPDRGAGVPARPDRHGGRPPVGSVGPTGDVAPAALTRPRAALVLMAEKAPFFALAIMFAALARWGQEGQLDTLKTLSEHTVSERIAQASYGLAFYPLKTLWPAALSPIYDLPDQMSPLEPRYLLPGLAVLALTAVLFVRRRRWPACWVAWLCYGAMVSPVLGIQQSGPQLVAGRYSYLSCMPFALLAGGALHLAVRRSAALANLLYPVAFAVCAMLGVQSFRLSGHWRDSERLWTYAAAVQPNSPLASMNLGVERKRQAEAEKDRAKREALFDESIALYRRAIEFDPTNARIYSNLANLYSLMSDQIPARRDALMAEAVAASARALELSELRNLPIPEMRLNHGVILFKGGRTAEALREFDWFVRTKPEHPYGRNNLGMALIRLGRPADAIPHLEAAVRTEPSYANGWRTLGDALRATGQRERAIEAYQRALNLSPNDAYSKARLREMGP